MGKEHISGSANAENRKHPLKERFARIPLVLWVAEAGLIGATVGMAIEDYLNKNPSEPTPIVSINENINFYGGQISVEGSIPTGYVLFDGTSSVFDRTEVEGLRQQAISSNEPTIIAMFPYKGPYISLHQFDPKHPEQHPQLLKLPEDVLSDEELREKGVTIIQSDHVSLHIRKSAFEKDGPLARFNDGFMKTMTIALIDGSTVSRDFMQDPKYDKVRSLAPESDTTKSSIEEYKKDQIKSAQEKINSLQQEINQQRDLTNPDQNTIENLSNNFLHLKARLFALEKNLLSTEQIKNEKILSSNGRITRGKYTTGGWEGSGIEGYYNPATGKFETRMYKFYPNVTIFLPVEDVPETPRLVVYFSNDGSIKTLVTNPLKDWENLGIKPNQSYPDPSDFEIDPAASPDNPESYPYGAYTQGFSLRHEVAHDILIAQRREENQEPNHSEYDTDMVAMEGIRKAWEKWQLNRDNSGYHFIFRLPDGGYIATTLPKVSPNST